MKMINFNSNEICAIYYCNQDKFDIGIILFYDADEIIFQDFNVYGEYDGYVYQINQKVEKISYNDKYVKFMKKIIDRNAIPSLKLVKKIDFINYAILNNRVLAINTTKYESNEFHDIKVLECDNEYITYHEYDQCAKLYKKIHKVKLANILMMQVDSKYNKRIEKARTE